MPPPLSEESFREHLPQALVLLRKARGFTQQELASRADIQQPVLCRYETGVSTPTSARLAKVLHALVATWTDLDLALAEVRRALEHDEEPSPKAILNRPPSTKEDLMLAFMTASQEGRGQQFIKDLIEQGQSLARLQSRMNLQKALEGDDAEENGDRNGESLEGDSPSRSS